MNSQPLTEWHLIMAGRYQEAIDQCLHEYQANKNVIVLGNCAKAYLLLKDYPGALAIYETLKREWDPKHHDQGMYIGAGICHWAMGKAEQALQEWQAALHVPYVDAAGGVVPIGLLYYAAVKRSDARLRKKVTTLLNHKWKRYTKHMIAPTRDPRQDFSQVGLYNWPGALVPFLLGHLEPAAFEKHARSASHPTLQARHLCQADFYLGVRAFEHGDWQEFRARMHRSASSGGASLLEVEGYLARWEVDQVPMPGDRP